MNYAFLTVPNLRQLQQQVEQQMASINGLNQYGATHADLDSVLSLSSVRDFLNHYALPLDLVNHVAYFAFAPNHSMSIHTDTMIKDFKLAINIPIANGEVTDTVFYRVMPGAATEKNFNGSRGYWVYDPEDVEEVERVRYVDCAVVMNIVTPHNVINHRVTSTRTALSIRFSDDTVLADLCGFKQ
jgi:hypothetical protein